MKTKSGACIQQYTQMPRGIYNRKSVQARIEANIVKDQDTGCNNWAKSLQSNGYGQIGINGKPELVHRASYETYKGKIPEGLFVLHSCDNRKCCNPEHLSVGTQQQNIDDMMAKGRWGGNAILTLEKAREIRQKFIETTTCRQLATEYGVNYYTILNIIANRRWTE